MSDEIIDLEPVTTSLVPANLFGAHTPAQVIEQARLTATPLAQLIEDRQLFTLISGKRHVRVEGWTLLGSMLGVFPVVVWTHPVEGGWEARVEARTQAGAVVGAAEAECLRSESKWKNRDDYALRSMAQTRATSKALRLPLGFVIQLAGFDPTPLEEMDGVAHEEAGPPCPHCGSPVSFASEDERAARTKPGRKAPPVWSCSNRDCGGGGSRDKNDPAKGNWPWGSYEADFFDKQTLVVSRGTGTKPEVPADAWPVDPLPPTGQTLEQAREEAEAHVNCGVDDRSIDSIAHSMTELFRMMSAAGLWPADAYQQALAKAQVTDLHTFGKKPDLLRWAESLYQKAAAKLGEAR